MATKTATLKEKGSGDVFYPVTKAGSVFMDDDTTSVQSAISELNGNSGVKTVTLDNATPGANSSFYYKVGHVVCFFFDLTPTSSGQSLTIFTFPSGYRPLAETRWSLSPVVHNETHIGTAFLAINTRGIVQIYMTTAVRTFVSGTFCVE